MRQTQCKASTGRRLKRNREDGDASIFSSGCININICDHFCSGTTSCLWVRSNNIWTTSPSPAHSNQQE